MENTFTFDKTKSASQNFVEWFYLNCEERDLYNEPRLSQEEAQAVFNKLYSESL
jgi:hypothetical protein